LTSWLHAEIHLLPKKYRDLGPVINLDSPIMSKQNKAGMDRESGQYTREIPTDSLRLSWKVA